MKRRNLLVIMAAIVVSVLSSCSSMKVVADYDKSVDFNKYKTIEYYGWNEDTDKLINDFDRGRIENAFKNEFESRDLQIVEKGEGELVVSLFLVLDQKTSTTAYTNHYGSGMYRGYYGYGYGGLGMTHSTTTYQDYDYVEGTLIVDVFDAETKALIWQGIGSGTVDDNPQTRERNIPKAVAQIMAKFPVEAK